MSRNVHADLMIQAANDTSIKWDFSRDGVTWTGTASPTWLVELQYRQKPQSQQEMKDAQSTVNSITAALAQPEPTGDGWLEATIAWEVCASIHEKFAKGKDALYKKRHADFVKHLDDCRAKAIAAPPAPILAQPCTTYTPSNAYYMVDRFLRNNLDDDAYAEYSGFLDSITEPTAAGAATYRNLADDAALKRSFDAMQNGIVAELRKELADMTAHQDKLVGIWQSLADSYAKHCKETNADRLDAQRYRWLCDNNFDKVGVTQIHTLIKTWEPHSQTGEPQLWSQRTRGGKLDAAIDAAINNNQNQEMQLEIAKRAATMSDINSMTRFDSSMTREQIIEKMNQLTNTKPVVIIKNS